MIGASFRTLNNPFLGPCARVIVYCRAGIFSMLKINKSKQRFSTKKCSEFPVLICFLASGLCSRVVDMSNNCLVDAQRQLFGSDMLGSDTLALLLSSGCQASTLLLEGAPCRTFGRSESGPARRR